MSHGSPYTAVPSFAGTFAVVSLMVGDSINKVLANYPLVDEACHISMSSSDVTEGLLNNTNGTYGTYGTYGACASVDECREMCNAVTTSVAITIAFVTGIIMVRALSVCCHILYIRTYTDGHTQVHTY